MDPATDPLEEVEAFLAAGVGLWPNVALGLQKCVRDNRDPIAEANSSVDIIDANRRERQRLYESAIRDLAKEYRRLFP